MPVLDRFDGGLNTRRAPHLIARNEAVKCVNADLSAGTIKSIKGISPTGITVSGKPKFFEGNVEWYSNQEALEYFEHQRKLYWTSLDGAKEYTGGTSEPNPLGTVKPITELTIVNSFTDPVNQYAFDANVHYSFVAAFTPDGGQALDKAIFKISHPVHGDIDYLTISGIAGYAFSRYVITFYNATSVGDTNVLTASLVGYSATNPATPAFMIPHGASYTMGLYIAESGSKAISRPRPYQQTFTKSANAASIADVTAAAAAVAAASAAIPGLAATARAVMATAGAHSDRLQTRASQVNRLAAAIRNQESSVLSETAIDNIAVYTSTVNYYAADAARKVIAANAADDYHVIVFVDEGGDRVAVATAAASSLIAQANALVGYAIADGASAELVNNLRIAITSLTAEIPAATTAAANATAAAAALRAGYEAYDVAVTAANAANAAFANTGLNVEPGEVAAGIAQEVPRLTVTQAGYVRLYLNVAGTLYLVFEGTVDASWSYVFWNTATLTTGAALQIGYVQYVYTYFESTVPNESNASPLSLAAPVEVGVNVELADIRQSTDPFVDYIRLYRVGLGSSTFSRIVEIPIGSTTYSDGNPATATALPADGDPPDRLMRYLTFYNGLFFGCVENRLYFTAIITNWNAANVIYFNHTITGLSKSLSGLLVFAEFETYLLTGNSASTFVSYEISGDQGCKAHESIAAMNNQIMWLSSDGVCTTTGGSVRVLSKYKLGKQDFNVVNAVVHDETYYAQLADGRLLAFDMRYEPNIKYYDFQTEYLVVANDTLYGQIGESLYSLFTGDNAHYTYTTGQFDEGAITTRKEYNTVQVNSSGAHLIEILIDGESVQKYQIEEDGITDIAVPQDKKAGYSIQFKASGVGEIKAIAYFVKVMSNG